MTFLLGLVPSFIPEKFRKAVVFGALTLLAIGAFFGAKALYDRSVIDKHATKQEAKTAKADRKADNNAAEQRRLDDTRIHVEEEEIRDAVEKAEATGGDRRAAYYHCIELQQRARRDRKPPPNC